MDIQSIRESERRSHIELYSSEELYKEGSWLNKPIRTVTDLFPMFEGCKEFRALDLGSGVVSPIEDFAIETDTYDLILAVSALEHIDSRASFVEKLKEMRDGIKTGGVVCLVINSEVREKNKATGEVLYPQFEVNLPTEELKEILQRAFEGWEIIKSTVREQQYDIPRDGCVSELTTNVVTFAARK